MVVVICCVVVGVCYVDFEIVVDVLSDECLFFMDCEFDVLWVGCCGEMIG